MIRHLTRSLVWLAVLAFGGVAVRAAPDAGLAERARSMQAVWNGVVVAPDGRLFAVLPRLANPSGPSLVRVTDAGAQLPYPSAAWNGSDPAKGHDAPPAATGAVPVAPFVGLSAIHLAPDGAMWAVDTGSAGYGRPATAGAARLLRIDLAHDQVTRILTLPTDVLRPHSMIANIRFNGGHAYVTDAGAAGLIVLDLATGGFRRVLDRDPALTAQRPIPVDGEVLRGPDGRPAQIDADQLEVSPDGRTLFVQPSSGPMSRIETALLDDPRTPADRLQAAIRFWYDTPPLGGTAIAPDGTLYLNDLEDDSILALSPSRALRLVVRDPRLHWADAPVLGADGTLTVPVPQLDRAAPFRHGHAQFQFPILMLALRPAALLAAAGAGSAAPPARPDHPVAGGPP